ncbi:MAG: glycogen synthase GlgA [Thermodesulfovibrionales bacterium]|nr:glycogen synthase GlgA [Thermodesulfovibrionales bacterium]
MKKSLKILVVASEAAPFAKEGGLGDVVGTMPKYIKSLGHDIRIVMPRYYKVNKEALKLKQIGGPLGVPMGIIGTLWGGVFEGRLPNSEVPVYFIEYDKFFGREGLYTQDGQGYLDNDNRFVFLSRGALELAKMINFKPDVIHVHDWQTAIIPVFINTIYRKDPLLGASATVLTIHNMQHQGNFYEGLMDVLAVGWEHFNYLELEAYNSVNLLKGGIYHSTLLTTVSKTYSEEIQTPEYGYRLEGVVRERAKDLYGILNGVDYDEWNPETDKYIKANYSEQDLSGKAICKSDLQQIMGLPIRDDVPIIGIVSRLVYQKGIDVLATAIYELLGFDIQMVMLGSGEPWAHFFFGKIAHDNPTKFAVKIGYDNSLAHKIEAGADFFLMPSRFEPCGLNQMFSLRYGTLPIVRATGGLNDTVENFNEQTIEGTGFKFYDLTPKALINTVGWAIHTYYNNKQAMSVLIKNAMAKRFTWDDSARQYEDLYYLAVKRKRG